MRIRSAHLADFRNIGTASLDFSAGLTALVGQNGQGKTNAIEALYAIAALRPMRNVPRVNLIRSGAEFARIELTVFHERTGLDIEVSQILRRNSRTLMKDTKNCEASRFLGSLTAVAFTPDDLQISKGPPDLRRKFVDRAVLNTRPAYLESAMRYARALKSRNRVLADDGTDEVLEAFDQTVASSGAAVAVARAIYVRDFAPRVIEAFHQIADPAPPLTLRYRSSLGDTLDMSSVETTAAGFAGTLFERRRRDRARRTTSVGPHIDDLEITLDGESARLRASQGQHRALVLAIKIAEIAHLTDVLLEPPVLLLDDISSELDTVRSGQLFDALVALDAQVVLTTTDERQIPRSIIDKLGPAKIYDVDQGVLTPRNVA